MEITWLGHSCFRIRGSQATVISDPYSPDLGYSLGKPAAQIVTVSHQHPGHSYVQGIGGEPKQITGPGEYEIKDVSVQGISSFHDFSSGKERGQNTIYIIEAEDIRLCHLGDLGQKELTPEQLEKIGDIDILMIPVGGVYTISIKEAMKIMSQIEPSVIIPMHYQIPKLKLKLDGLDKFLKIMGIKKIEPISKLSIKKKDISTEEAKIVILKPSS